MSKSLSMDDAWTCESIRNREMSWGPMEDHQALASAMRMDDLTSQVIARARQLGQSIGLATGMHQLRRAGLIALALVLIFEGLLPLVAPGLWRRVFSELMRLQDGQIRFYGLVTVALGLLVWWWPGN